MRVCRVATELVHWLRRRVEGADRFGSINRTGWRDLWLCLLVLPRSMASISTSVLPVSFCHHRPATGGEICLLIKLFLAILPQRRVRFGESCVRTIRGRDRDGTPNSLLLAHS